MSEVVYGKRGAGADGNCPRCNDSVHKHLISQCDISDATAKAVTDLIAASKSIAGKRIRTMDKETKRQVKEGNVRQDQIDVTADHMVGALHAQTVDGRNIKLVAVSGPAADPGGVHGWEGVTLGVPMDGNGWNDIYGNAFRLPTFPAGIIPTQPCAAVKLLLRLGQINKAGKRFNFVHLYEEACRGVEETGKKSKKLAAWHGQGGEKFIYAAHSCKHCEARVPTLLCDRAE